MNSLDLTDHVGRTGLPAAAQANVSLHAKKIGLQALIAVLLFVYLADFPGRERSSGFDAQIVVRLAIAAACGLVGLWRLSRSVELINWFPGALSVGLGLWATMILPASIDPARSIVATCIIWCVILFVPAVMQQLSAKEFIAAVLVSQFVFFVACWITYLIAPEFGGYEFVGRDGELYYRFGGLVHPNGLGHEAAIFLILLLATGLNRWTHWKVLAAPALFALVTLIRTESRTSIIAAALAALLLLCCYGILRLPKAPVAWFLAAVLIVVLGTAEWNQESLLRNFSRSGDLEEVIGANGRADVWEFAVSKIADSPLTGYGCGCGYTVTFEKYDQAAPHAHNQFLGIMMDMGVPGGLLLAGMVAALLWSMVTRPDAMPDGIFLLLVISGITEIPVFSAHPLTATLLWIAALHWRKVYPATQESREPAVAIEGTCP